MKKALSTILAFALLFGFTSFSFASDGIYNPDQNLVDMTKTRKTEDIVIRNPCVLAYGGKYFLYGTGAATCDGYGCYISEDLENWAGPVNVFEAAKASDFDGIGNYWAPECVYYNGSFYLFATYLSGTTNHRGVSIMKSDSPLGPFYEITDGHITPKDWDCIDGTLYIDKNGEPWMIFVHEWTSMQNGVGDMSYAKLSDDLTHFVSDSVTMFKANDPFWSTRHVTDGPFPYRTKDGSLIMLWSNIITNDGYAVGIARSSNGEIDGKWTHDLLPLYHKNGYHEYDGGHGMLFETYDGRLMLSIHSPNSGDIGAPHAVFIEIEDTGSTLGIKGEHGTAEKFFENIWTFIRYGYEKIRFTVETILVEYFGADF